MLVEEVPDELLEDESPEVLDAVLVLVSSDAEEVLVEEAFALHPLSQSPFLKDPVA